MEVPLSIVQAIVTAAILFVFKVVFGLINKNETACSNNIVRVEGLIKHVESDIKELERKFVSNDRDLYNQVGELREKAAYERGLNDAQK